jgi:hypothetical protein
MSLPMMSDLPICVHPLSGLPKTTLPQRRRIIILFSVSNESVRKNTVISTHIGPFFQLTAGVTDYLLSDTGTYLMPLLLISPRGILLLRLWIDYRWKNLIVILHMPHCRHYPLEYFKRNSFAIDTEASSDRNSQCSGLSISYACCMLLDDFL